MGRWALDSGAFTELSTFGRFETTTAQFIEEVRRFGGMLGMPDWIAPQDWMCEPQVVTRTGLSVEEHQRRTIMSVSELRMAGLPVIPVIQGWHFDDYRRHVDLYDRVGMDLRREVVVGVGSVCRRQGSVESGRIFSELHRLGLQLHGFGVKTTGLARFGRLLKSADSMAWSFCGRRNKPVYECGRQHKNCANCFAYAMWWRERVLSAIPG